MHSRQAEVIRNYKYWSEDVVLVVQPACLVEVGSTEGALQRTHAHAECKAVQVDSAGFFLAIEDVYQVSLGVWVNRRRDLRLLSSSQPDVLSEGLEPGVVIDDFIRHIAGVGQAVLFLEVASR